MSYEISLLQPTVFMGLIERFKAPEELTLLNRVPTTNHPFPTASWEITRGSRTIAEFNVPNSEANIVDSTGRSAKTEAFAYIREKKVFSPTTMYWLREAARNVGDYARISAEAKVLEEVADLNRRLDNRAEWMLWQSLTGKLDIQVKGGAINTVDYGFRPDHFQDVQQSWATATPIQIVKDIRAVKKVVERHSGVKPTDAFTTEDTLDYVFDAWATGGVDAKGDNKATGAYLTDAMKTQYYASGTLPNFMGLNWSIQSSVYDATGAGYTENPTEPWEEEKFLGENKVVVGNFTANRPIELMQGPTADFAAPQGFTGKFSKTSEEFDPSARQALIEWHLLPVITQPDQFAVIKNVTG